jgi:hypothetical protein
MLRTLAWWVLKISVTLGLTDCVYRMEVMTIHLSSSVNFAIHMQIGGTSRSVGTMESLFTKTMIF